MKILYIEDEVEMLNFIKTFLDKKYFIVDLESDGEKALSKASMNNYDLIIIDINIPKINGIDICKKLREIKNETPIIFLTANEDDDILIKALKTGGDDYIKKPFNKHELLARIESVLRRSENKTIEEILFYEDFKINIFLNKFYFKNSLIYLTKKEFNILLFLFKNKNIVKSVDEIYDSCWDSNDICLTNSVESAIRNIRKKIKKYTTKDLLKNQRAYGYYIGDL